MFSIKELLSRYSNITLPDETVRREAVGVIGRVTGISLPVSQVKIRNQELIVEADPGIRSVIYTQREKIRKELESILGKKAPRAVR